MPTYTYKCSGCEAVSDAVTTISRREEPQRCAQCGGEARYDFGETHKGEKLAFAMDLNTKLYEKWGNTPGWMPPSTGGTTFVTDPRTGKVSVGEPLVKRGRGTPGGRAYYAHEELTGNRPGRRW